MNFIAPNYCYSCGKIGELLCCDCKKYNIPKIKIIKNQQTSLINLELFVDFRSGFIKEMINDYKFGNVELNSEALSEVIICSLAQENKMMKRMKRSRMVIVPVPTIKKHIRERGFDHTQLLAKDFCEKMGIPFREILERNTNTSQRGASAEKRLQQAKRAFRAREKIIDDKTYVLLDDVKTTGATLDESAKVLRRTGAKTVWAIYVLQQKNDK